MYSKHLNTIEIEETTYNVMELDNQVNVCYASGKVVNNADTIRRVLLAHNA